MRRAFPVSNGMKLTPFQQFIAVLSLVIAVLGGLFYFVPFRIFSAIENDSAAIIRARSRISFLELATRQADANERKLRVAEPALSRIRAVVLNPDDPLKFIEAVENLGKTSHVDLAIDLIPGDPDDQPSFRLTVLGKTADDFSFLKLLENGPVFIQVRSFEYQKLSAEEISSYIQRKKTAPPEAKIVLTIQGLIDR